MSGNSLLKSNNYCGFVKCSPRRLGSYFMLSKLPWSFSISKVNVWMLPVRLFSKTIYSDFGTMLRKCLCDVSFTCRWLNVILPRFLISDSYNNINVLVCFNKWPDMTFYFHIPYTTIRIFHLEGKREYVRHQLK